MRTYEENSRQAFRCRDGRHLEILHGPSGGRTCYWIPFESRMEISSLLAGLEAKNWWQGYSHSMGFLWHVNVMREVAGLRRLALDPCRVHGSSVVESPPGGPQPAGSARLRNPEDDKRPDAEEAKASFEEMRNYLCHVCPTTEDHD